MIDETTWMPGGIVGAVFESIRRPRGGEIELFGS